MEAVTVSPYLRLIQKTGSTRHPRGILASDIMLRRMNLNKTSRVLDVGCGVGSTCAHIAKTYGCLVTGVDVSSEVLFKAQALYKYEPYFEQMRFQVADIRQLPFADNEFDAVLCESVLFFVSDKEKAINEMARVVKPEGYLGINELCLNHKPGYDKIKDYFLRPELGGFLAAAPGIMEPLLNHHFDILLQDEQPFDLEAQLKAELNELLSVRGLLQLFEITHQAFTNKAIRQDLLSMLKFSADLPKKTFTYLNSLLVVAQKKPPVGGLVQK